MSGYDHELVAQRNLLLVLNVLEVDIEKYFHSFVISAILPILKSPI